MMSRGISAIKVGLAFAALLALAVSSPLGAADAEVQIINVYDAFGNDVPGVTRDGGFSALIRYGTQTILFDSGTNADILARNLKALGIDPQKIDFAVASHSHPDHISGFDYLLQVNPRMKIYFPDDWTLGAPLPFPIAGPETGAGKSLPVEQQYFRGSDSQFVLRSSGRFWKANVEYVTDSREIAPGVHLVATRSPLMGYFSKYPPFEREARLIGLPELSVSLATPRGEVLVVGCSHSGIESIVMEAKKLLKHGVDLIAGGLHLLPYNTEQVTALVKKLKSELGVRRIAPAHCTGHIGFKVLKEQFGEDYLFFGLGSSL